MCAAVEEKFAQCLASNDSSVRNKALKRFRKWIAARSAVKDAFTELELMKLWKGLHVCMWHSDKPLIQEELAGSIAKLVQGFHTADTALSFVEVFFTTVAREWLGIDRLRLDKYYMLIRKVVHHSFQLLKDNEWDNRLVEKLVTLLEEGPLNPDLSKTCLGVQLHVVEVYVPELLKTSDDCCHGNDLIEPCLKLLANTKDSSVLESVCSSCLDQLLDESVVQRLSLQCSVLSGRLHSLAIDRSTVGRNRKTLYQYCKRFSEVGFIQEEVDESTSEPPPEKAPRKKKRKRH